MIGQPYDAFEEEVMDATREAMRKSELRPLLFGLVLVIAVGLVGLFFTITGARSTAAASREDVLANRELTEQVRLLQEANGADVHEHRDRNEDLHADLCRLVFEVARAARIEVTPCRPAIEDPMAPTPTPTPSLRS